jgi:hypothetical protein
MFTSTGAQIAGAAEVPPEGVKSHLTDDGACDILCFGRRTSVMCCRGSGSFATFTVIVLRLAHSTRSAGEFFDAVGDNLGTISTQARVCRFNKPPNVCQSQTLCIGAYAWPKRRETRGRRDRVICHGWPKHAVRARQRAENGRIGKRGADYIQKTREAPVSTRRNIGHCPALRERSAVSRRQPQVSSSELQRKSNDLRDDHPNLFVGVARKPHIQREATRWQIGDRLDAGRRTGTASADLRDAAIEGDERGAAPLAFSIRRR